MRKDLPFSHAPSGLCLCPRAGKLGPVGTPRPQPQIISSFNAHSLPTVHTYFSTVWLAGRHCPQKTAHSAYLTQCTEHL